MGTDIHTAAEVWRDGVWHPAGRIFNSPYDWDWFSPYDPEDVAGLSDHDLLNGLRYELQAPREEPTAHEGIFRDQVPASLLEKVEALVALIKDHGVLIEAAREESRRTGWDYYGKVKPREDELLRVRREVVVMTPDERAALVDAVVTHNRKAREAGDDEGSSIWAVDVRLDRTADDPYFKTAHPYEGRNYRLFAALANVRNGSGFAGVDTGDPVPPILEEPNGWPKDMTTASEALMSHEHTPCHLTLSDLEGYDWNRGVVERAVVSEQTWLAMQEAGTPDPYDPRVREKLGGDVHVSGGVSGPGIVTMTPKGYKEWLEAQRPRVAPSGFRIQQQADTRLEQMRQSMLEDTPWPEPEENTPVDSMDHLRHTGVETTPVIKIAYAKRLREQISPWWFEQTLPALRGLVPEGGSSDDVRIIFDFDS